MSRPSPKEFIEAAVCHVIRMAGYLLPRSVLWLVLFPVAAIKALWELAYAMPTVRHFNRLPVSLRPSVGRGMWLWRLWSRRAQLNLTKLLYLWPDRLQKSRWQSLCRYDGIERFESIRAESRPVILAVLHFGPLTVLVHWLRACGVPAAALADKDLGGRSMYRRYVNRLSDRANGLAGVPLLIRTDQHRDAIQFLTDGRVLIVTMDGESRHRVKVREGDFSFDAAPGAFQLAEMSNAVVIPCLISAEPRFEFTIHFGRPIPPTDLVDRRSQHSACQQALRDLLPVIQDRPELCSYELLYRLYRRDPEAGSDSQEVRTIGSETAVEAVGEDQSSLHGSCNQFSQRVAAQGS